MHERTSTTCHSWLHFKRIRFQVLCIYFRKTVIRQSYAIDLFNTTEFWSIQVFCFCHHHHHHDKSRWIDTMSFALFSGSVFSGCLLQNRPGYGGLATGGYHSDQAWRASCVLGSTHWPQCLCFLRYKLISVITSEQLYYSDRYLTKCLLIKQGPKRKIPHFVVRFPSKRTEKL